MGFYQAGGTPRNKWVISAAALNNDLRTDLIVAQPYYSINEFTPQGGNVVINFAGRVLVFYPTLDGVFDAQAQIWREDTPGVVGTAELGDHFGSAVAPGDFNGDGWRDLAIGAPGEADFAGAVIVIHGGSSGLSASAGPGTLQLRQGSGGLPGAAESQDQFGSALAANDFSGDGRADLAIGAPYEQIGSVRAAGAVIVVYGSSVGLSGTVGLPPQLWHQNIAGIDSSAEYHDLFGSTLSAWNFGRPGYADLAIGVPGESLDISGGGEIQTAGAVTVLYSGVTGGLTAQGSQLWHQNSPGIPEDAERDDEFGKALY